MRIAYILGFLTAFAVAFGAVPAKKAATKQPVKKVAGKNVKAAASRTSARKGGKANAKAAPFRSRQQQPTADRYMEIQRALADKGYLKSEPSGVWGPESIDALKQFQAEQNIPVTGKLSSKSIIGLGLGPRTAGPLVMPQVVQGEAGEPRP